MALMLTPSILHCESDQVPYPVPDPDSADTPDPHVDVLAATVVWMEADATDHVAMVYSGSQLTGAHSVCDKTHTGFLPIHSDC